MHSVIGRLSAHKPDSPPLELDSVSLRFNGVPVLEDISFRLRPGELLAVVGPNGAGKTTLFRIIAGTLSPTSGRVRIFGHNPSRHVCIAYLPQRSKIDWTFPVTVREVVMMGRVRKIGFFHWPKKRDWELVSESLARVGIADLGDHQIGELSGGQQQRAFLARALAQEADLILLDEPLSGLDIPSQEAIFEILGDLRHEGIAVLVATHDLNLAATYFDQVMLLNRRLVAVGRPDQVISEPILIQAYGDHMHRIAREDGDMVLTDTCCGGEGDQEP
jgi:manganese/iron transport system ATP-binding protein